MSRTEAVVRRGRPRAAVWFVGLVVAALCTVAGAALAATTGKIQGRVVAAESGEPIGFADVLLVPVDTTLKRLGGMTNADGTFLLEAAPGDYTLQIRALSYTTRRIEGIHLQAGDLLPQTAALVSDAIPQQEIVVEARAKQNTEAALLSARKKAATVGDAVSAEQVRRSPDKDAAEVLRRVTGLSVSNGKYVFVRGLGERYSSTEVDGVRITSPEQNKRVVPLDLVPANLLDNIVVQKTYTADRPGEFGGGDVQLRTKDFPGKRTWSVSVTQGAAEGSTFRHRQTYSSGGSDLFGFNADARKMPDDVAGIPLPSWKPSNLSTLADMGRSFSNAWTTHSARTLPNAGYSATYGDELHLFGRPLGLIESWTLSRSYDQQDESQRFFQSSKNDTTYDYAVRRWTTSAQLGGISALSYRFSPRHTVHLRGIYTHSAEDEVRTYEGQDHNWTESTSQTWLVHRSTRFQYVDRSVLSGALEGKHDLSRFLGASLDWKLNRSRARRLQPDRRELSYDRRYYFEGDTAHWVLGSIGRREFGDLHDNGWGGTISSTVPYRISGLGQGKVVAGFDRQTKKRDNFYRRFNLYPNSNVNPENPPDSIYAPGGFDGSPSTGWVEDATLNTFEVGIDNYRARQRVTAGYLNLDVPMGRRARGNFGVRAERGYQDVQSYALFVPSVVLAEGKLDDTDWLPSGNVTWSLTEAINLRLAASRTVSRPDLNELSPSVSLEYVGGMQAKGNPGLHRALIDNYDIRLEAFPTLSEVLAAGFFFKQLHQPIEQVIRGGTPRVLEPFNSGRGHNLGVELEARSDLSRLSSRLRGMSINANASLISSDVTLSAENQTSKLGTNHHPLQGQARYLVNGALSYSAPGGRTDASILLGATGRRLNALGSYPLPDIYQEPSVSLDATVSFSPFRNFRAKVAAKNLLDPRIQQLQAGNEVSGFRIGRGYSIALSYGS